MEIQKSVGDLSNITEHINIRVRLRISKFPVPHIAQDVFIGEFYILSLTSNPITTRRLILAGSQEVQASHAAVHVSSCDLGGVRNQEWSLAQRPCPPSPGVVSDLARLLSS